MHHRTSAPGSSIAHLAVSVLLAIAAACGGGPTTPSVPYDSSTPAAASCAVIGAATATQPLDTFDWRLEPVGGEELGYRYYSRLAGDRGKMGDGLHPYGVTIANGVARLTAEQGSRGTSWAGLWYSLAGTARETGLVLDPRAALPGQVTSALQVSLASWTARVKGNGRLKIELRSARNDVLAEWSVAVNSTDYTSITREIASDVGPIKLLNVVAESPADLTLDEITFETRVPALTPLRYAFLLSYAQLLRCYDPATGLVRDHAQWPVGDFDAVPGLGFVALGAATAADLGVVSYADANAIATRAIDALLRVPREPRTGWLPHWLKNGQRHPDSEWSTVDTALALLSALQAATILDLGDRRAQLRALLDGIDFDAVTNGAQEISHGLDGHGRVLPNVWDAWGGETALLQLLRGYRDPCLPDLHTSHSPPAFRGRGFITELGALFVQQLGGVGATTDRWNVNWYNERLAHYRAQRSHVSQSLLFGLSPAEVISSQGATGYLEGGIGTQAPPSEPLEALTGFDGPWRMPHYIAMSASLDLETACQSAARMRELGLLPPLGGPAEGVMVGSGDTLARWHSVQTALNAFFNTLGFYHAITRQEGRADVVYQAVTRDSRYAAALGVIFPPAPSCSAPGPTPTPTPTPSPTPTPTPSPTPAPTPPATLRFEGESGWGDGHVMARSNASGQRTIWLHAGESRSHSFSLGAATTYSVSVRYSNDNYGPTETVTASIDGADVGSFQGQDTGDNGEGWNHFVSANNIGSRQIPAGSHTLSLRVAGGDGYGIEIDVTTLD
jgi:hypothetical protein